MSSDIRSDPNRFASELFAGLPSRYDQLGYLLSFGQDRRWRSEMVGKVRAAPGGLVLDVATGTAGVALEIHARTRAEVVGLDLSASMLEGARQKLEGLGERGVHLVQGHGEELPFADDTFDSVTFTYLLRYVKDPKSTVAELARVVRPGGVLASLEFYVPPSPLWRGLWWCYTRCVLPVAGLVTGGREWFDVGRFLGPNISSHYQRHPLSTIAGYWRSAGVRDVGVRVMSVGGGVVMWGTKAMDA